MFDASTGLNLNAKKHIKVEENIERKTMEE